MKEPNCPYWEKERRKKEREGRREGGKGQKKLQIATMILLI